ncbi:MAG TPA: hypothetical protein VFB80_01170 [Pirellulaceae bacterium]|nr:hypothetical protein [Pirellulaceae bacterium]
MKSNTDKALLHSVERNDRALLFKARWDRGTARQVVPPLIRVLESHDASLVLRALSAFLCIGPEAHSAARSIAKLLTVADERIFNTAAIALAAVSLKKPKLAVSPLLEMSKDADRLKYAMFGLVELGPGAKSAGGVFVRAYDSRDSRIRRLALRGLKELGVDARTAVPVLKRALSDSSQEIRKYAKKILATSYD